MESPRHVVIVDAYSAGNQLPRLVRNFGHYKLVHVHSKPIPDVFTNSFKKSDFDVLIEHEYEADKLVAILSDLNPVAVFAGAETGVELADHLSEKLGLRSNGTTLSPHRRDKYLATDRARQSGLLTGRMQIVRSLEELSSVDYFPCVIKPRRSAGGDGVAICANHSELKAAFDALIGQKNKLEETNQDLLVQEYISGQEYAVNSVSFDGKVCFSLIWEYNKIMSKYGTPIYDWERLIDFESPEGQLLGEYQEKLLSALGIKWGPAHGEIKIRDGKAIMIELGARVDGWSNTEFESQTTDQGQLEMTVHAFLGSDHSRFKRAYQRKKHAWNVALIAHEGQRYKRDKIEAFLRTLKSFNGCSLRPNNELPGMVTRDIFSSPGYVHLMHTEAGVIESDYQAIRRAEETGVFSDTSS